MMIRLLVAIFRFSFLAFFLFFFPTGASSQKPLLKTIIIDAGHGLPNSNARGKYSYESQLTLDMAMNLGKRLKEVLPNCNILYTRTDENLPHGLTDIKAANRWRAEFANESHGDLFISIHVNSMEDRYVRKVEGYRKENYTVSVGKGKKRRKITKTRTVPIYKSYKVPCSRAGTETYIWAVDKYDQKENAVGARDDDDQFSEKDTTGMFDDTPDAKIMASLRTKRFFNQSLTMASFVEEEFKKLGRPSYGVKQRNNQGIWVLQATNMPSILVETGFICNEAEEDYMNSEKGQNEIGYAIMRAVLRYKQLLETGSGILADEVPK